MDIPPSTQKVILKNRPDGYPELADFETIDTDVPDLTRGDVLLRTLYLSVDPYMRLRMYEVEPWETDDELIEPWADSWKIGDPLVGASVCEVIESTVPDFSPGDIVTGGVINPLPFAEYCTSHASRLSKVDRNPEPVSTVLGPRGMPGRTAYFGLLEIGRPTPGETVVISAASGAVGSVAGQIAKLNGCHVVGITGSDQKIEIITDEFGFDEGVNYNTSTDLSADIHNAAPDGVDIYFDNVGGEVTDAVLKNLNVHARIPVCGQIALYNESEPSPAPRYNYQRKRVRVEGFSHRQFAHKHDQTTDQLRKWLKDGSLVHRETVIDGLEKAPKGFLDLFSGQKIGKQVVKVADPDTN